MSASEFALLSGFLLFSIVVLFVFGRSCTKVVKKATLITHQIQYYNPDHFERPPSKEEAQELENTGAELIFRMERTKPTNRLTHTNRNS